MPSVGSFSVWIQVDRKRLPEYAVEVKDNCSEVTCWVPSEAGKNFEICYADSKRQFSTSTHLWVDGVRSTGKILHARSDPRGKGRKDTVAHRGLALSQNTLRPYMFADCELVEDEDFVSTLSPGVGEIECLIQEVKVYGYRPDGSYNRNETDLPPLRIQERAKKGVVHGTKLGRIVKTNGKPSRTTKPIRNIVSFKFKYRPLAVLIAEGIAPNAEQPPKIPNEVIDLTLDDNDNVKSIPVKRELKRERSTTYDVIDLT